MRNEIIPLFYIYKLFEVCYATNKWFTPHIHAHTHTPLTIYEILFISAINTPCVTLACELLSMQHAKAPINAEKTIHYCLHILSLNLIGDSF